MNVYRVEFSDRTRARLVEALTAEDAVLLGAGKKARSAKHEADYGGGPEKGGHSVYSVLMNDCSNRRGYVERA